MTRRGRWIVAGAGLIAAALGMVFAGFVYDVLFAGIPYQDPPPDLAARYRHHATVAEDIMGLGIPLSGAGVVALVVAAFVGGGMRRP
jgi:hypothetical protein